MLATPANLFHDRVRRGLWRLKMNRNRPVSPRIIQLMTPVRNKHQLHTELPRRRIKAPRLIPQLPRKHQHPFHVSLCPKNMSVSRRPHSTHFLECGGFAAPFTAETTPPKSQSTPNSPCPLAVFLFRPCANPFTPKPTHQPQPPLNAR